MTLVPTFPNRLRRMVEGLFTPPINDNGGKLQIRWETPPQMKADASEHMKRILGALHDLSEPMQREVAKAVLAMARSENDEFMGVGDADTYALRELTYGLVVLEEGPIRRNGGPMFRMPRPTLRKEIRAMSVETLIALARPRRW